MVAPDEVGAIQLRFTWCGLAVPLRPTFNVGFVDELLEIDSWPVALPTAVGLNFSVTLIDWPGLSFAGKLTADDEKPVPATDSELTVTGAVPVEVSETVCVVELSTTMAPNEMLLAFTVSTGEAAFNCSETDLEELPLVAVTDADVAVVTAATFAVKEAEVDVAGTVIEEGTVTEPLLLTSTTLRPPDGAEPESVTLQESARAPVIEVLPHVRLLIVGTTVEPVPLKETFAAEALLETESCPATEPAEVGLN